MATKNNRASHNFKPGDHLAVPRHGATYEHHGIYVGDDCVIHYTGDALNKRGAKIRRTSLAKFCAGQRIKDVRVVAYGRRHEASETIARAERRLGEDGYNLFGNNCEHFAYWCATGKHHSEQVKDRVSVSAGGVGAGAAAVAGLNAVGAAGGVKGLSGAGMMSGLRAVGGVVGGGTVAGLGTLATVPAMVSVGAMHKILEDDPMLSVEERDARFAGRTASTVGGVAGVAA